MFAFHYMPAPVHEYGDRYLWFWPLVDTIVLTALTVPVIYFWAIKPFIVARNSSEAKLGELKTTLDLLPDRVYVNTIDDLDWLYINQAGLRAHDLPVDFDCFEKPFNSLNSDIDVEFYKKKLQPIIEGVDDIVRYESVGLFTDAIEVTHQLVDRVGETPRYVTIIRDISEHKKAEKAKSEFLSTVSHELRTPLTSINGALGLLTNGVMANDPKGQDRALRLAYDNGKRLSLLIDDILDFEKLNAGALEFHRQIFNVNEFVSEAAAANEGLASKLNVSLILDIPQQSICVEGDKKRLFQVLNNLISNAAKFNRDEGYVKLSVSRKGNSVRVCVEDNGLGISEASRSTLFDRFTQADSTDVRAAGGTGLGLSISKEIIERHGGRIDFASTLNKGSTFFFELPLAFDCSDID